MLYQALIHAKAWQFLAFASMICGVIGCGERESSIQAPLELSVHKINLGEVLENSVATTSFTIRNTSKSTISLAGLAVTCGCLKSEFAPCSLGSGEQVDCEIRLTTSSAGKRSETVTVLSDSEFQPEVSITFTVLEGSHLVPSNVHLGVMSANAQDWPQRLALEIQGYADSAPLLRPTLLIESKDEADPLALAYQLGEETDIGPNGRIVFKLTPATVVGRSFSDKLRISWATETSSYEFDVTVSGILISGNQD